MEAPLRPPHVVRPLVGATLLLAVAGCAPAEDQSLQPTSANEGIQATGRIDGAPVAISRGAPIVRLDGCDPIDGPDEDLCIEARTIDGLEVTLVIENRDALVAGATVPVGRATCTDGCDDITGEVIARVEVGDDRRIEVTDGEFEVERADDRWIADFDLTLPFGDRLRGDFDVAERLPVQNPEGVLRSVDEDGEPADGDGG